MRLEDLTIALRPRQPWEAIDLGCTLVRRDYGRLLAIWGITVLPLWVILAVLLRNHPGIFPWVAWWLKPLYDRVPLFFISRAAFGVRPRLKECLKAWPRLWCRFPLSALLLRRLSPIRSFALPVWMLEGQRGKAVRDRVKALATDSGSSGFMATYAFLKLEVAVFLGLWSLASFVSPEGGVPDISEWISGLFDESTLTESRSPAESWYINGLYLLAVAIIEPFYVGAGFGLYLNSRIKLEGWDIELTFRKLAARLQPAVAAVIALFLILSPLISAAAPAESPSKPAAAAATQTAPEDPAAASAKEILSGEEFKVHKIKRKVPDFEGPETNADFSWLWVLLTWLAWAVGAGLVALLIWWIVRNQHLFRFSRPRARLPAAAPGPKVVMGLNIARESLPADLLAAARHAWQAGQLREALSLLYRGALSRLVEQRRLPIRDSDTEDDCLLHVAKTGERPVADYFRRLTLIWVRAAYAGIEATAQEFDELCHGWPFDSTTARPRAAAAVPLIFLLGFCLSSVSCKWREEEMTIGYKGKARNDPFLAAQYLLREFDHDASKLTVLKKLPEDPSDNVLVLSGETGISEGRARQLLQWVDEGGHLIYALAGCRPYSDWNFLASIGGFANFGNEEREDPLLTALNVEMSDRRPDLQKDFEEAIQKKAEPKSETEQKEKGKAEEDTKNPAETKAKGTKKGAKKKQAEESTRIITPEDISVQRYDIDWQGQKYQVSLPDYLTLKLDRKLRSGEFSAGPADNAAVLGLRRGLGRITVINHARPFRNRYLADQDHASLLVDLVGEDYAEVQFVLSLEGSFWSLLWQKAWMLIIAIAVLVLLWLWRNLPRFGPVGHVELHETKHFVEHIAALGHFFHSLRRDDILLSAAADAVRARALRRFPHLHAGGEPALQALLMERSGLPEDRVRAALVPPASQQPHHLVRILHDLQTLRQSLA